MANKVFYYIKKNCGMGKCAQNEAKPKPGGKTLKFLVACHKWVPNFGRQVSLILDSSALISEPHTSSPLG